MVWLGSEKTTELERERDPENDVAGEREKGKLVITLSLVRERPTLPVSGTVGLQIWFYPIISF